MVSQLLGAVQRALVDAKPTADQPPIWISVIDTPVGPLAAAANDDGLCLLEFGNEARLTSQLATIRRWYHATPVPGEHSHLERTERELTEYFDGRRTEFTVPLVAKGTPFQEQVWRALLGVRFGETCSYSDVAERLGRPSAQRAVGLANGQNRISIIIPCHRVIEKGGGLRGYGGGLWRKEFLLTLEQRVLGRDALQNTPLGSSARADRIPLPS
jgi:AraC family transcriptional regulator of adaptative response/methylated-DNA-[protein]-cysteine methyltransferase